MFLPYRTPNRVFTIVGGGLAAVAFGALIILCIPWMRVYIDCHAGIISHDAKTREVVKNWCDFTIIVFQILIFLVVGGTLFTDELARGVNRHLAHIVTAGDDYWTASELDIKARVLRHIDSIRALRVGLTTLNAPVRFIKTIWMVYRVLRIATQSLPRHTAAFLSVRLVNRWQSGAPGFFAFVLIFVWLALQVAKTYYDYSAECS
jgi:hypothetical protein